MTGPPGSLLTCPGSGGYGSRPLSSCPSRPWPAGPLVVALATLAACGEQTQFFAAPTDRFFFPTGLALRHVERVPGACAAGGGVEGCQTQLFVASSNADLRYEPASGGTLVSLDVDVAVAHSLPGAAAPTSQALGAQNGLLGVATIGSLAGEVTVLDAATCPGWGGGPQVLVPTRGQGLLHRLSVADSGALTCATACAVPMTVFSNLGALQVKDPWQVVLACGNFPPDAGGAPVARALGFATYLNVESTLGALGELQLDKLDNADDSAKPVLRTLGVSPTRSAVFDPASTRLFATQGFASLGVSPLRWLTLAAPEAGYHARNFAPVFGAAAIRTMALSTDRKRAYLGLGLYDPLLAASGAALPVYDVGTALAVVDLTDNATGDPSFRVLDLEDRFIGRGIAEMAVLPRPAGASHDVVAVTSTEDGTLALYEVDDAGSGQVVNVLGHCQVTATDPANQNAPQPCPPGAPLLGKQPFGLAVEALAPAADPNPPPGSPGRSLVRLFVGSFDRGWVNVVTVDPSNPGEPPVEWVRIGPERT